MTNQVNLRLSNEAISLLQKFAPSPRAKGEFLERLIFEHERSLYDRMKFREVIGELASTLSEENVGV